MKSTVSIFFVMIFVALCFFGCSNIPEEPATTSAAIYSYVAPSGATKPAPQNVETTEGQTFAPQYVETINNVEVVLSSYYVYGNSVATIEDVKLEDDGFRSWAEGRATVRVNAIGSRSDDIKIGYTGYDADGNVVRKSYILIPLDKVKKGEVVENRRFDFPRETVKIVFENYVETEA